MSTMAQRKAMRKYRTTEKGRVALSRVGRRWRLKVKREVLTHYGNDKLACVKCGEENIACLSIDHINGGGENTLWK